MTESVFLISLLVHPEGINYFLETIRKNPRFWHFVSKCYLQQKKSGNAEYSHASS